MKALPRLYVPDFAGYAQPFYPIFDVVHDPKRYYDVNLMKSCDFLMLTGGADINPKYYGHEKNPKTQHPMDARDEAERRLLDEAILADIPILGICRGAQWLGIAAGATLIQHVTGHDSGEHWMFTDDETQGQVLSSSAHHQMVDLHDVEHELLAWTNHLSREYRVEKDKQRYPKGLEKEPEVFYLPYIRGLGIQGHPEYMPMYSPSNIYFRNTVKRVFGL